MSIENANAFVTRIRIDKEFRNKLEAEESKEGRIKILLAEGLDFTEDEFKEVASMLSDEDLSSGVGGTLIPWCWCYVADYRGEG